jgi:hypothetical protein
MREIGGRIATTRQKEKECWRLRIIILFSTLEMNLTRLFAAVIALI